LIGANDAKVEKQLSFIKKNHIYKPFLLLIAVELFERSTY